MEQTKKIDVIVPVFNVKAYLEECLDSLLQQSVPINIILIDDGSTDGSGAICARYAAAFPDVITYESQENMGLSSARNNGLKLARAPYVAFMDSDDWVSPDYYEALLNKAEETGATIVASDITYVYQTGEHKRKRGQDVFIDTKRQVIINDNTSYPSYLIAIFPMVQNKLWRASLIKDTFNFLDGRQYEDLDFFYRVYPAAEKIAFTTKGTFYYRQRNDSIVKTSDERVLDIIPIFKHVLAYYHGHDFYDTYRSEIEYLLIRNALVASARRLAYSRDYRFIRDNLVILFDFVETTVPNWRKNPYIKTPTLRHLFIKTFSRRSVRLHAVFLRAFAIFLRK